MDQFLSFMSGTFRDSRCGEHAGSEQKKASSVLVGERPRNIPPLSNEQRVSDQEGGPKTGVPLSSENKTWICPVCKREYPVDEIGEVCTSDLCPGSPYYVPLGSTRSSEKTFCFAGAQSDEDLEALETAIHIECTEQWA